MVIPLAVYHTTEADMVMNHQSTTMVMVTNHRPTEATNPLKDLPIQQQLLKKRAADMKASQTRKLLETLDNFITTIYGFMIF